MLQRRTALVFEPHTAVSYDTPEFHFQVRVNNLGFRGEDRSIGKTHRFRIVVLGDSYTFGWGVDNQDTWPKVLEDDLQKEGTDAEVFNLGQPNAYPSQYAEIAQRAIPLLKPDLVIVALNQGDDVAQTMIASNAGIRQRAWSAIKTGIKLAYPTLTSFKRRLSGNAAVMMATEDWKGQTRTFVDGLDAQARARFDRLDEEMKNKFLSGDLNPGLLSLGLYFSESMQKSLVLDDPIVQSSIREIGSQLSAIKREAGKFNGKLGVVAVPNSFFVSARQFENYRRMGFVADSSFLKTTAMDDACHQAAEQAGAPFFSVTQSFRETAGQRNLYYNFDGHFTAEGQHLFADSIAPFAAMQVSNRPGKPL